MAKLKVAPGTYALFTLLVLGSAIGNLSQTGINALLGSAMAELGVDMHLGQWLSTGYMLVMGVTVPLATYLYEKLSSKAYVLLSYALFTLGSLIDVFAPNFGLMLLGRIVQAIAVGLFYPSLQNVAMTRFPPGYQATAMGIAGIALGFAPNVGPIFGGLLDTLFGWRSFSLVLFVMSAILLVLTIFLVRNEVSTGADLRFERLSFIYSVLGFGGLLLGFSQVSNYGFLSLWVWIPVVLGVVFLVLFVRRQKTLVEPLMNLDIFRSATFVSGLIAVSLLFGSFMGVTLVIPQYVQNVLSGTSLQAGLVMFPTVLTAIWINPLAGVLSDKTSPRSVCIVFGVILCIGAIGSIVCLGTDDLIPLTVLQTIRAMGVSGLIGPLMAYLLSGLKGPLIPHGSSASVVIRQIAGTFGAAFMVLCMTVFQPPAITGVLPAPFPYEMAFVISALMAIGSFIVILWKVKPAKDKDGNDGRNILEA